MVCVCVFFLNGSGYSFFVDSKTVIGRSKQLFPQHLDVNQMQAGLLSGKYKRGSYQQSRDNYLEGLVFLDSDKSNGKDGESTSAEPILVQVRTVRIFIN
jgi:hypothetical protein